MILSKAHLIRYIRSQLGEPLIQVELNDTQIGTVIDDTVGMFADVVYGDFHKTLVVSNMQFDQYGSVKLPIFSEVLKVAPMGTTVMEFNDKKDIDYTWNSITRELLVPKIQGISQIGVIGIARYIANDENDHVFNETWIKAMAKAKTQKLWGHVVGKYSQSLVGGATINYDRLISEADDEIGRLMEELHDKWVDPAPVMVT